MNERTKATRAIDKRERKENEAREQKAKKVESQFCKDCRCYTDEVIVTN